MNFFHQLPPSVLQAGAIFLSIIIEALPFVLIGSIISGLIEVFLWYFYRIYFPFLRMWNCPHYQSLFGKESAKLYSRTFYGDGASYQSYRSLCNLLCFWKFL